MHSTFPFLCCFLIFLFSGSILSVTASNWLTVWLGLELNLMSFLPLIAMKPQVQETESAIKYFLIQAMGSGLILLMGFTASTSSLSWNSLFVFLGLSLKLGAAPLHFWLPGVMSGLSWLNCLLLATWQKVAPLFVMVSLNLFFTTELFIMAIMSALIGGLMGMNQTSLRALLAYSSIGHVGWLLALSSSSTIMTLIYFSVYISILIPLFLSFHLQSLSMPTQITSFSSLTKPHSLTMGILLLSLGGIPPLTGFFAKWAAIQHLINVNIFLVGILVLGALMNLYYYLIMMFSFTTMGARNKLAPQYNPNFSTNLILLTTPALVGTGVLSVLYALTLLNKS